MRVCSRLPRRLLLSLWFNPSLPRRSLCVLRTRKRLLRVQRDARGSPLRSAPQLSWCAERATVATAQQPPSTTLMSCVTSATVRVTRANATMSLRDGTGCFVLTRIAEAFVALTRMRCCNWFLGRFASIRSVSMSSANRGRSLCKESIISLGISH